MSEPLEALLAQRELIQQHLDWLDAQISTAAASADELAQSSTATTLKPKDLLAPTATSQTTPQAVPASMSQHAATSATTTAEPLQDFDEDAILRSNAFSDIKRAQFGCLALFIILTLSFLLFLFGLPF